MNQQEFKIKFFKELGGLAITLGEQVSKERLQAYLEYFERKGFTPAAILFAIDKAVDVFKFFPKPVELAELITGGKAPKDQGKAAWAQVLGMLHNYGAMRDKGWPTDGATAKAVNLLGGWGHLAHRSHFDLNGQQMAAAFEAAYDKAANEGLADKAAVVAGVREVDWKTGQYPPLTYVKTAEPLLMLPKCEEPRHELLPASTEILGEISADLTRISHRTAREINRDNGRGDIKSQTANSPRAI